MKTMPTSAAAPTVIQPLVESFEAMSRKFRFMGGGLGLGGGVGGVLGKVGVGGGGGGAGGGVGLDLGLEEGGGGGVDLVADARREVHGEAGVLHGRDRLGRVGGLAGGELLRGLGRVGLRALQ